MAGLSELKAAAEAVLEFEVKKNPLATGNRYLSTVLEDGFASHATPTAILSLIAHVERLEAALRPFVAKLDQMDKTYGKNWNLAGETMVQVKHLHDARTALEGKP